MTEQNLVDSLKTQLNAMVKFPDQNPNPVLKMSMDGTLVYRNEAGHQIVQRWGLALGDTMPTELVSHAKTPNDEAIELAVGNRTYSFHVVAVPEIDSINVYGADVTAKKPSRPKSQPGAENRHAGPFALRKWRWTTNPADLGHSPGWTDAPSHRGPCRDPR